MPERCQLQETFHELNDGQQHRTQGRSHHVSWQAVVRQTRGLFSPASDQSASESQTTQCLPQQHCDDHLCSDHMTKMNSLTATITERKIRFGDLQQSDDNVYPVFPEKARKL